MNTLIKHSFFILSLLLFVQKSNGHGLMCIPRQRGAYVDQGQCGSKLSIPSNPVIDWCPFCSNRGGFCGKEHLMRGGRLMPYAKAPIVADYKSGQEIDFSIKITAHHNGYMLFHLCDLDSCGTHDIDQSCFDKKKCYMLERIQKPECENKAVDTHDKCGPVDPSYPKRWYLPCPKKRSNPVKDNMYGGSDGTMRYKLPYGVTCEHCVIQWQWWSANACNAPGVVEYFEKFDPFTCPGGVRVHDALMRPCAVPEEFAACADVKVSATGAYKRQEKRKNAYSNQNKPKKKAAAPFYSPLNSENPRRKNEYPLHKKPKKNTGTTFYSDSGSGSPTPSMTAQYIPRTQQFKEPNVPDNPVLPRIPASWTFPDFLDFFRRNWGN